MSLDVLVIQPEHRVPLGRLRPLEGITTHVVNCQRQERLPMSMDGYAGLIVLGGSMSVHHTDQFPWLLRVAQLIDSAHSRSIPVLGVCLGAQLAAMALGGDVATGQSGPELGLTMITATSDARDDELWSQLPDVFPAPQSHFEVISALPRRSVVLASSAKYPIQAFRIGSTTWGVQYHPEVELAQFSDWMQADAEDLAHMGSSPARVIREYRNCQAQLHVVGNSHAQAFARIVAEHARRCVGELAPLP